MEYCFTVFKRLFRLYTVSHKKGDIKLMAVTSSKLNRFLIFFLWHIVYRKFAIKGLLKIPPHLNTL